MSPTRRSRMRARNGLLVKMLRAVPKQRKINQVHGRWHTCASYLSCSMRSIEEIPGNLPAPKRHGDWWGRSCRASPSHVTSVDSPANQSTPSQYMHTRACSAPSKNNPAIQRASEAWRKWGRRHEILPFDVGLSLAERSPRTNSNGRRKSTHAS